MKKQTQRAAVLQALRNGESVTPLTALRNPEIRTLRLAARIFELRSEGHIIHGEWKMSKSGHRYMSYYL